MTFRTKLLLISSLTVSGAVALVTGAVSVASRRAFERMDRERRGALLEQFQREMKAQGEEVVRKVERVAASDAVTRMAIEASRVESDFSLYLNEAQTLAEAQSLDFLDLLKPDQSIISSAHWPARFGYLNDWQIAAEDWKTPEAFLARIPLPDGTAVALAAIRRGTAGDRYVSVAGAKRLDRAFLDQLGMAPGMRALLWLSPHEVFDAKGPVTQADRLTPLIDQVQRTKRQASAAVQWTADRASSEALLALPLEQRGNLMGVLIVATSLAEQVWLERSILSAGLVVGGAGIVLGILLGWWTTERISRPVAQLAAGARAVAGGDWTTRVAVSSSDEIGELARTFNQMTEQLVEQRDRTIQAERVAAWRELARRLAHELKNPLFPLQITVENMQRARERHPEQFDEVFRESTTTLLAELTNLKTIIGRFSDFAKMPPPHLENVDVNEVVQNVKKLFDAQFPAALELAEGELRIQADPEQLGRALRNLVLNAMDAMPEGGTLTLRTGRHDGAVRIQVSDTGQGLTEEECSRLFTPYYTTKNHGTGLGLAIAQSVVSDHHGRIAVASEPGRGTTFTIDLPERRDS